MTEIARAFFDAGDVTVNRFTVTGYYTRSPIAKYKVRNGSDEPVLCHTIVEATEVFMHLRTLAALRELQNL